MYFVRILKKIDRVITAPHYILLYHELRKTRKVMDTLLANVIDDTHH